MCELLLSKEKVRQMKISIEENCSMSDVTFDKKVRLSGDTKLRLYHQQFTSSRKLGTK